MIRKWNIWAVRNCLLFIIILTVMAVETAKSSLEKEDRRQVGRERNSAGYTPGSIPKRKLKIPTSRQHINREKRFKGDLCSEDPSNCEFLSQPQSNFHANIRQGRSRRFRQQQLVASLRPVYLIQRSPMFLYPPSFKAGRDVDAVDVMEHLLVKGMEMTGLLKEKKKKKLTIGKGNRPYVWNESEDTDFDADFDVQDSFSTHRPTGNIYYAGNKYYSGSHDNINLLKKYGVDKWKHSKYHLKPVVYFEDEDDYDDLWDREYDKK